jgi:hypothetical protein
MALQPYNLIGIWNIHITLNKHLNKKNGKLKLQNYVANNKPAIINICIIVGT